MGYIRVAFEDRAIPQVFMAGYDDGILCSDAEHSRLASRSLSTMSERTRHCIARRRCRGSGVRGFVSHA